MSDNYAEAAEFYDIAGRPYWRPRAATVTAALAGAAATGRPVVDIGAGTGLLIEMIGTALPEVPLIAVEPSAAMRAALASRLLANPTLAHRVTILPTTVQEAELPEQLGGVVACGMLGYLSPAQRVELWQLLAERLAPEANAVVDAVPFPATRTVRPIRVGAARFGAREHEIWLGSRPAEAPGMIELTTLCRIRCDDRIVRESVSVQTWFAVDMTTIVAETARAGLACRRAGWDLATLSVAHDRAIAARE